MQNSIEYRFGPFNLTDSGRILMRNGENLQLSPKALAVLVELLRVPGKVFSKSELLAAVWPDSFVEEANLTQTISVLRKQFAADFPERSPVETIPRVGYRFREPVEIASAEPDNTITSHSPFDSAVDAPSPPEEVTVPATFLSGRRLAPTRYLAYGCASLVLALAGMYYLIQHHIVEASFRPHRRVAVLSFRDLSGNTQYSWLTPAFEDTMSTDLESGSDLQIVPNEDVDRAEKELGLSAVDSPNRETLHRLCTNLDCDEVVTGSYLVVGNAVRLDTHLFDARDGKMLGEKSLTESVDHLLPLIAATSQSIRGDFGLPAVAPGPQDGQSAMLSTDPVAYLWFAKGLEKLKLYDGAAAAKLLENSIAVDPKFAQAHLEYAVALTLIGEDKQAIEQAQIAQSLAGELPRRIQLDIDGRADQTEHHYDQAAATYRTLSNFYPDDDHYRFLAAAMLEYAGHLPESASQLLALVAEKTSAAQDPLVSSTLSDVYGTEGDWPNSLLWARRGEEQAKQRGASVLYERLLTSESQAQLYMHQFPEAEARTKEALGLARQFQDPSGALRALNRLGQIDTAEGRLPEAQASLEQALVLEASTSQLQREIHTLSAVGQNLERAGDHAKAFSSFEQELALAKSFQQPECIIGAELDLAREQIALGRRRAGLVSLKRVADEADQISDKELLAEANDAISHVTL